MVKARWWNRRMCTHLLLQELQSYNLLLNNHQQEKVGFSQKKIPQVQGQRRSPCKIVGRTKSRLESNPIPARDAQRAQTNPWLYQDPETPQKLNQTSVLISCGSTGLKWPVTWAGILSEATCSHSLWHKPS